MSAQEGAEALLRGEERPEAGRKDGTPLLARGQDLLVVERAGREPGQVRKVPLGVGPLEEIPGNRCDEGRDVFETFETFDTFDVFGPYGPFDTFGPFDTSRLDEANLVGQAEPFGALDPLRGTGAGREEAEDVEDSIRGTPPRGRRRGRPW